MHRHLNRQHRRVRKRELNHRHIHLHRMLIAMQPLFDNKQIRSLLNFRFDFSRNFRRPSRHRPFPMRIKRRLLDPHRRMNRSKHDNNIDVPQLEVVNPWSS